MACQTGIRADKDLKAFFEECKRGKIRLAKFVINKGSLLLIFISILFIEKIHVNFHVPLSSQSAAKDWKNDWNANVPGCVDSYEPCFLLFRLNTIHDWALIR
jgi:hypothetical protein